MLVLVNFKGSALSLAFASRINEGTVGVRMSVSSVADINSLGTGYFLSSRRTEPGGSSVSRALLDALSEDLGSKNASCSRPTGNARVQKVQFAYE